jgi:hypothetical protein
MIVVAAIEVVVASIIAVVVMAPIIMPVVGAIGARSLANVFLDLLVASSASAYFFTTVSRS